VSHIGSNDNRARQIVFLKVLVEHGTTGERIGRHAEKAVYLRRVQHHRHHLGRACGLQQIATRRAVMQMRGASFLSERANEKYGMIAWTCFAAAARAMSSIIKSSIKWSFTAAREIG